MQKLGASQPIINWITLFLSKRTQRVRINSVFSSETMLNGEIPQGTLLGMEAFTAMIDDLKSILPINKNVDDGTTYKIQNNGIMQIPKIETAIDENLQMGRGKRHENKC